MNPSSRLQLLVDKRGAIIGASSLAQAAPQDSEVQLRIEPMEGQSLLEVSLPAELAKLDAGQVFQRLTEEYHLPRGSRQVTRKRRSSGRKPRRRRS